MIPFTEFTETLRFQQHEEAIVGEISAKLLPVQLIGMSQNWYLILSHGLSLNQCFPNFVESMDWLAGKKWQETPIFHGKIDGFLSFLYIFPQLRKAPPRSFQQLLVPLQLCNPGTKKNWLLAANNLINYGLW